uniref:Uncharacterized protein n=1 Tax=Paramoeba aestuarina TaxID=180227 RepID=A0A7S4KV37_9EUKA
MDEEDLKDIPITKILHRQKILNLVQQLLNPPTPRGSGTGKANSDCSATSTTAPSSPRGVSVVVPKQKHQVREVSVKCIYKDKVSHFMLTASDTFETFQYKLRGEFGCRLFAKYKDEEGDLVTIRNERDVRIMYAYAQKVRLTLILYSTRPEREKGEDGRVGNHKRKDFKQRMEDKKEKRREEREREEKEKRDKEKGKEKEERERGKGKEREEKDRKDKRKREKDKYGTIKSRTRKRTNNANFSTFEVLESFVDAVVSIDHRGIVLFFNGAAEDMFGWDREEMLGKNVNILMNDQDSKAHQGYLRKYRQRGRGAIMGKGKKVTAKSKQGRLFDVWLSLSETNVSYTAIIQEIQEGMRVRPTTSANSTSTASSAVDLSELFSFFDTYNEAVLVTLESGIIQYANKKVYATFGHDNLVGAPASIICPALCSSKGKDLLSDYLLSVKHGRQGIGIGAISHSAEFNIGAGLSTSPPLHDPTTTAPSHLLNESNQRDVLCYTSSGSIVAMILELSHQSIPDGRTVFTALFKYHKEDTHGHKQHLTVPGFSGSGGGGGGGSERGDSVMSREMMTVLQVQREVIASLLIPAMVINQDCLIQEMNSSALELFGYSLVEVLGRNVSMLMPVELREYHTRWVQDYAQTKKGKNLDGSSDVVGKGRMVVGISKGGRPLKIMLSVTAVDEREIEGEDRETIFTGILQPIDHDADPISQNEKLQQQISVLQLLALPACIITQDSKIRGFNPAAEELFGYKFFEVDRKDVSMLIPPGELRAKHPQLVQDFYKGKKKKEDSEIVGKERDVIGRHKNGHNIEIKLSVTELKDEEEDLSIYTGIFTTVALSSS